MGGSLLPRTGNRAQIGQVAAPDGGGVLGHAAGAGKEGRVDQAAIVENRKPVRCVHRCLRLRTALCGDRSRVRPAHAAGRIRADCRFLVPPPRIAFQRVGPAGHGLGLAGFVRKVGRQLGQQNAGKVGMQVHTDDLSLPQDRQENAPVIGRRAKKRGLGRRRRRRGNRLLRTWSRGLRGPDRTGAERQRKQSRKSDGSRSG